MSMAAALAPSWGALRYHEEQCRFWRSSARFQIAPAGRRSGKSRIARWKIVRAGLACPHRDGRFVLSAPTRTHAKDLHWEALKSLIPAKFVRNISETELSVWLKSGVRFQVMGMEKPQRVEGSPLDGFLGDEFADMKEIVWSRHVRAALDTGGRPGIAILIGVPEGRNHYYDLYRAAREGKPGWAAFHWKSADILPAHIIAQAKAELDPLVYEQEFEASFVVFAGRAYYNYDPEQHGIERLSYDPKKSIAVCFDFNVEPGVAAIVQEQTYTGSNPRVDREVSGVIGEVWIPSNSNTEAVCRRIIKDWGAHEGPVCIYGDATGGRRGTAAVQGSDWDLVRRDLKAHFKERLKWYVPDYNPSERGRINAVNTRLGTPNRKYRLLVDPRRAPHVCRDFEGVQLLKGGSGEIDKAKHKEDGLTHISDAVGYYIVCRWPVVEVATIAVPMG